ncbi:MAG: hypothetical protein EOO65_03280 [Methanosarcinales archaeon]|nr:MAG: hypothetical protein EOO65_03280 [Methanosarcinales archaeon]
MQQWGRIALLAAMFVTAYLIILAWQKDYGPNAQVNQTPVAVAPKVSSPADIPNAAAPGKVTDIPSTATAATAKPTAYVTVLTWFSLDAVLADTQVTCTDPP